jgi:hypothetical protein
MKSLTKRALCLCLSLILVFGLAACSGREAGELPACAALLNYRFTTLIYYTISPRSAIGNSNKIPPHFP